MRLISKLWVLYAPFRGVMAAMFGFTLLGQLLNMALPFLIGLVFDRLLSVTGQDGDFMSFFALYWPLLAALLALELFQNFFLRTVRALFEVKYVDKSFLEHVARLTMNFLMTLSVGQHVEMNSSEKRKIVGDGQTSLADLARIIVYDVLPMMLEVGLVMIALCLWNLPMGLTVLGGIVVFWFAARWVNSKTKADRARYQKMERDAEQVKDEVVSNVELVISNAQEERAKKHCDRALTEANQFWRVLHYRITKLSAGRDLVVDLTKIAVIVMGAYFVFRGRCTAGQFLFLMSWSLNALSRMGRVGSLQRDLMRHRDRIQKFIEFMGIEPAVKTADNPVRVDRFHGRIEFRDVTFFYPGEQESALTSVNFLIRAGERVAIVGESGAGKSSITRLLLRHYDPKTGWVLVDGYPLTSLDPRELRQAIGRVEQEVEIFDETLRFNLTFGTDRAVTDAEILEACRKARVDQFLGDLKNGLDTRVGEHGHRLSGGQRQRVGIARALLKDPAILILDEATSSLDAENEFLIQEALEQASIGRTTITIAHRFSTVRTAQRVLVLKQGAIVGSGTHKDLATDCEEYQRLVRRQTAIL